MLELVYLIEEEGMNFPIFIILSMKIFTCFIFAIAFLFAIQIFLTFLSKIWRAREEELLKLEFFLGEIVLKILTVCKYLFIVFCFGLVLLLLFLYLSLSSFLFVIISIPMIIFIFLFMFFL